MLMVGPANRRTSSVRTKRRYVSTNDERALRRSERARGEVPVGAGVGGDDVDVDHAWELLGWDEKNEVVLLEGEAGDDKLIIDLEKTSKSNLELN